jgi:ribose transport system permease protein
MTVSHRNHSLVSDRRWLWALTAVVILWLIEVIVVGRFSVEILLVNATLATFLALAGVAQAIIICSGDGSFDLSLPYVITVSAYLSAGLLGSHATLLNLLEALAAGLAIGVSNAFLVARLRLPAIVATLASGYIVYSFIIYLETRGEGTTNATLGRVLRLQIDGASIVLALGVATGLLIAFVVARTVYGRRLQAMGQSRLAARLANINNDRMIFYNFALSGLIGAFVGILLAAYDGGAFQDMGSPYLLGSVAAVVVGGNPVTGGDISIVATVLGALIMTLLVAVLESSKLGIGYQDILEGLTVIVIVVSSTLVRNGKVSIRRRT